MTRWTHALRRPGPTPDRCMATVGQELACSCDGPIPDTAPTAPDGIRRCVVCLHELVPSFSGRPSDSPQPPR